MIRRIALAVFVLLWCLPVLGLAVSSLREREQILTSGWWRAMLPTAERTTERIAPLAPGGLVTGSFPPGITAWGISARAPAAFAPGETAILPDGRTLTITADGGYRLEGPGGGALRVQVSRSRPPVLTLANYARVIGAGGVGHAFLVTLAVAIPGTVIPVTVAALAAYALAWMEFRGRAVLIALVIGLMAVPLQMVLIPVLRLHAGLGLGKGYLGIWLAHTGFGLPIAIYLLRGAMAQLPGEVIAAARLDGASEAQIFRRIALPLCAPVLAAFAAFQFLWVWNDLLVATVFLGSGRQVLTDLLRTLAGARGGEWDVLAAAAMVSVALPLAVFAMMRKALTGRVLAGIVRDRDG